MCSHVSRPVHLAREQDEPRDDRDGECEREAIARRSCSCGVEQRESVTPIEKAIDEEGHGVCRLHAVAVGIIAVTIVQQQNRRPATHPRPCGVRSHRRRDGRSPTRRATIRRCAVRACARCTSPTGCETRAARERADGRGAPALHDRVGAKFEVTPYVRGRPEVKFPVVIAVVAERVPLRRERAPRDPAIARRVGRG